MDCLVKLFQCLCCNWTNEASEFLRIGAFNVERFSNKKFNDEFIIGFLLKIISRFDLILLEEVMDKNNIIMRQFVDKLSKFSNKPYACVMSENLGRKRYKEQYVFIYRSDIFKIIDRFHYEDGSEELQEDTFEREPFVVLVQSKIGKGDVTIIFYLCFICNITIVFFAASLVSVC